MAEPGWYIRLLNDNEEIVHQEYFDGNFHPMLERLQFLWGTSDKEVAGFAVIANLRIQTIIKKELRSDDDD